MANEHTGHRDRLRERYLAEGLDGFPPHNVLELLLLMNSAVSGEKEESAATAGRCAVL